MIEQITSERASEIIDTRKPHGLYILQSGDMFVGIDNETGDAWTEEFKTEKECRDWLNKEVTLNPREIYMKALMNWGEENQITMVFEEMSELQKELCKHMRGQKVTGAIAEEIADVEIMLDQMKLLFEIETLVEANKRYKLARLDEILEDVETEGGDEV